MSWDVLGKVAWYTWTSYIHVYQLVGYLGPGHLLLDGCVVGLHMLGVEEVAHCVLMSAIYLLRDQ